jgi:hypothetical protein
VPRGSLFSRVIVVEKACGASLRHRCFLPLYSFFTSIRISKNISKDLQGTAMLPMDCLREIEELLSSGQLVQDFQDGCENDRFVILDFLEKLMDLGEAADAAATEAIFKGSYLEMAAVAKDQK